jgi:metacaspase-1
MIDLALCIGINAYGHGMDLAGCVNDAQDWQAALGERGADTRLLIDSQATRGAILAGMTALVANLDRGQTGVITYSGHGTWVPDADGDEPDRRDEALCPADVWDSAVITDDELYEIFAFRAYGSRLIFISDSCHSGSVNRFAPALGYHMVDPAETPLALRTDPRPTRLARYLAPETFLAGERLERAKVIARYQPVRGASRTTALTLSGCRDIEYSYDAWFPAPDGGQRANGAFTRVALDTLRRMPPIATYRDWHTEIRRMLPSADYPQEPQLSGTYDQKRWTLF